MTASSRVRVGLVLSLLLCGLPRDVLAERLFVRADGLPPPDGRVARVRTLALDRAALAGLRARTAAALSDFPLGVEAPAELAVERFEPFAAGARAVVVEAGGERALALPDQLYYRGRVTGDPDSRVLVVASATAVWGFVATRGTVFRFGRDGAGIYRSWSVRDADPAFQPPARLCSNDVDPGATEVPRPDPSGAPEALALPPSDASHSPTLLAELAIDTDQEFRGRFASNAAALAYLADLVAATSAIYDGETGVRVVSRFLRLWNTTDPWSATTTSTMLVEVRNYWNANEGAIARDAVHFLSGKGVIGGIAYRGVLCWTPWAYGVSTVYGSFDLMSPAQTWDVQVFAHELGHNFGSRHTHCYDPPVDMCYNSEDGCYTGPTSVPPGGGTIMSYCHTLPGGVANVTLTFGAAVSAVLRAGAEAGMCIGPPCGDGILDPGEDCDDGNVDDGDCCSSACSAEPDGGPCDDGQECTTGEECAAGACVGVPVPDGTACADGDDSACTDDSCLAGACVGAPAPADGCKLPIAPGKGQLLLKDKTPDKGDQVLWKWTKGAATAVEDLGDPLGTDDYELCVYAPGPDLLFRGRVPAGGTCAGKPCWKATGTTGFAFKSKERAPDGMEQLQLKAGVAGAAKAQAKGRGDLLDMPGLGGLSLPIRTQLRRGTTCWEAVFSSAIKHDGVQFKARSD